MALSLPEDVLAALDDGEPDRLIGTPETHQIGFRSQPYALSTDKGKWGWPGTWPTWQTFPEA